MKIINYVELFGGGPNRNETKKKTMGRTVWRIERVTHGVGPCRRPETKED